MVSGSLALLYFLLGFHGGRQGSGPDRGRSPVEWGDFPFVRSFVRPYVRTSPPLGHPARPEAQPARPEAQPAAPIGDEVLRNGEIFRPFVRLFVRSFVRPPLWAIQPGLRPSQPGLSRSQPGLRPSQRGGRTYGWTNK